MKWKNGHFTTKRFTEKDIINLKLENQKLKDLEFWRSQTPPGPFTKPEDITSFIEDIPETKDKNNRMFIEIKLQKNRSTATRKNAKTFRSKKNHQNLDTFDSSSNLCQYFYHAWVITGLSLGVLRSVFDDLQLLTRFLLLS